MPAPPTTDLAPALTEPWLARHPRRVTAVLLCAAVFVRLILCLQVAAGPLPRLHTIVIDSDNHFFDHWGRHLAQSDWLQRTPLHPTADWMRQVAREAMAADPHLPVALGLAPDTRYDPATMETRLWDHWLGGPTFFQEPAYPYLIGLTYRLAGPVVWNVFLWQLALGVAGVLLVHQLARRLFSETAAAAAGALAVLAPIPLFYEVTLLRDALVAFVTLALALVMCWTPNGGRRRWLALGLAFGAAALVKQSFLFFPVLMGIYRLAAVRSRWNDRFVAGGMVAAGMGVAFLPLVFRNLAVGVPALALNGSASAMLAVFHTVSATPFDLLVGPEFSRVLAAGDGKPFASLVEAAKTHSDGWLGVLALNLKKVLYTWHGFESPNNVDFYIFRQGAPILTALPATFAILAPLAAIGVTARRAVKEAWPIWVAILASLPTLVLAAVLSRYRAAITVALLPLAGAGVVRLASWLATRRWLSVSIAVGITAFYLAWAMGNPVGKDPTGRARAYAWIGVSALENGEPSFAVLYLQESLRLVREAPKVEARLGQALLACQDAEGALRHIETAARSFDSAALRELHARALAALGRREEAIERARAALAEDPGSVSARALLERLERDSPGATATPPSEGTKP